MKRVFVLLVVSITFFKTVNAQLFKFTFDGASVSPGQGNTVTVQNATVSGVTRSATASYALSYTSGDEIFNTSGWKSAAPANSQYLYFTITADPGYITRIQSLGFGCWSTSTGPTSVTVSVLKGGLTGTVVYTSASINPQTSSSAPSSLTTFPFDVTASNIASDVSGTLTVVIYGSSASANTGNLRIDNLYVNGSILPNGPLSFDYINKRVGVDVSTTLAQKLEVNGNVKATQFIGDGSQLTNLPGLATTPTFQQVVTAGGFASGNVGIGITTMPTGGYVFAVNGDALFTKIKVKQYTTWPDYVFDDKYVLLPIAELEKYIQQNKHLPNVPSAADVKKDGIDVAVNQAALLQKIEELSLYIIDQNKKTAEQEEQIQQQAEQLKNMQQQIEELKQAQSKN